MTRNNVGGRPGLEILLALCLFAGGCRTATVLKDAALFNCGTNSTYLSAWWTNVPDKSVIDSDPIGGYQFVYWVDEAGNACHGDPGRNGQVGPAVINAFKPQAYSLATSQSIITEAQLKDFQEIPVSYANYSGSGPHFVQFDNVIWRLRVDGKTFQVKSDGVMSIPLVTDIGSKACVAPVALQPARTLFLPVQPPALGQDPGRCKTRVQPAASGAIMSEEDRKKYNVLSLPHGTEIFDVP